MTTSAESTGPFDLFFGLPLHILVNHAVVVLIPLGVIAVLLVIFVPRLRRHYLFVSVGLIVIGAVAAIVAEKSGESLANRVGSPGIHQEWGERLVAVAWALVVVSIGWAILLRFTNAATRIAAIVAAVAVVTLAGASVVLVILAGHSGAEVTWQNRISGSASASVAPTPTQTQTAPSTQPATQAPSETPAASVLSLELVAQHAAPESCWSVVNGNVYDLTDWIARHPGGSGNIIRMCGIDASADFDRQHGGQGRPESELKAYLLGALGQPVP
jgi:cytochrome b involved in lipid metabolism